MLLCLGVVQTIKSPSGALQSVLVMGVPSEGHPQSQSHAGPRCEPASTQVPALEPDLPQLEPSSVRGPSCDLR